MKLGFAPIKRKDHRTYDFHRTFGTIAPEILPPEFNFNKLGLFPDQRADGFPNACTAYAQLGVASNEDSVNYDDYEFTYRKTLEMMDAEFGAPCDMLTSFKACSVWGVKNKSETPEQALTHRRGPYFIVRKTNDYFDGLISAMWKKQGGISLGTPWLPWFANTGSDGVIPPMFIDSKMAFIEGHDWIAYGVKMVNGEPKIICVSHQGRVYGNGGECYFSRNQINALLSVSGSGAFGQKHALPEDIKTVKMSILETILSYIRMLLEKLSRPSVAPPVPPQAPEPVISPPKYDWGTPELARHSVRVICDEEGLSVSDKNELCATVGAESGWNTKAIRENYGMRNGQRVLLSTDRGIAQWNDYYHGKEITADEAINNPEKAVRLMCAYWTRGQKNLWVAYKNSSYKKYL